MTKKRGETSPESKRELCLEKQVDIWIEHSHQMWRAIYATPVIASAIFVGWYVVSTAGENRLGIGILVLGMILMVIQFFIVLRMGDFGFAAKESLEGVLPQPRPALFGLTGSLIARLIPWILFAVFGLLLLAVLCGIDIKR